MIRLLIEFTQQSTMCRKHEVVSPGNSQPPTCPVANADLARSPQMAGLLHPPGRYFCAPQKLLLFIKNWLSFMSSFYCSEVPCGAVCFGCEEAPVLRCNVELTMATVWVGGDPIVS